MSQPTLVTDNFTAVDGIRMSVGKKSRTGPGFHWFSSAAPEMPASAIRAIPGGRRTAPSRSHSAGHRGEDRNRAGDHRAMVARTGISGAPDSQRSTSPRRSKAGARIATITDPDPLFCWACGGTSQHATANALSSADKTSRRVLTILPEGSPVTSVRSPVSSHAEMAKR